MIAEVGKNYLLPLIPNNQYAGLEGQLAAPLLTGLATYGVLSLGVSGGANLMWSVLLGAGSEFAGSYAYDTYLSYMYA